MGWMMPRECLVEFEVSIVSVDGTVITKVTEKHTAHRVEPGHDLTTLTTLTTFLFPQPSGSKRAWKKRRYFGS